MVLFLILMLVYLVLNTSLVEVSLERRSHVLSFRIGLSLCLWSLLLSVFLGTLQQSLCVKSALRPFLFESCH